jgi:hypothetical protein
MYIQYTNINNENPIRQVQSHTYSLLIVRNVQGDSLRQSKSASGLPK